MQQIVFVVLRHTSKHYPNTYETWLECYASIRRFYDNHIIVIDNNSDYNIMNRYDLRDEHLINTTVIKASYPESRLFSPFNELLLINIQYDRVIIIHDGVVFKKYVDFSLFNNIKFIWHFDTKQWDDANLIEQQLLVLNNNTSLIETFRQKTFTGCMGCCCAITKECLHALEEKHKISALKSIIDNQEKAIAFERVFAILAVVNFPDILNDISFLGEVGQMLWGYSYNQYIENQLNLEDRSIVKIFFGRK